MRLPLPAASPMPGIWTNGTVTVNINPSLRLAALPIALLLSSPLLCAPAHGQSLSVQKVQRALDVLRLKPDLASQACLDKLDDLHKMEKIIEEAGESAHNPNLSLAHDVMTSDYEDATETCVPDAAKFCEAPGSSASANQKKLCNALDAVMSVDGSDEGEEVISAPQGTSSD
ncbi:hypothetical protein CD178_00841 [Komagataeibacter saccharivorans]|uniref:Uncharacterized protein n=1 Tax=Komagataeibacter saccharivorans TaxID=265959 RepID=A0A347W9V0_9PROT|nr:hypothetical protein [Komagataeibacter saccharivorans]AXY21643.1 hypothetical protein CD178_00841 [Komagataeibacter saccharivorans]QBL94439.1 hypothetical protein KSAC_22380 [Komagataeibacter saccharivorans]